MTSMDALRISFRSAASIRSRRGSFLLSLALLAVTIVTARWLGFTSPVEAQAPAGAAPVKSGAPVVTSRGTAVPSRPVQASAQTTTKSSNAAPAPQTLSVVAVVNGEQISRDQLAQECLRRFGKELLESLVNKHLIWQECQARGVSITTQDVEDEVERMAAKFGLSKDRWLALLQEERGISADQYRREIIWPTIALRRLAASQIEVTSQELRESFEAEYGPQVKVRMIAVSNAAKAQQILQEVKNQPDRFGDIAKEKSEDPNSAAARGQIPPIRKHVGHPEVEKAAFALKEGEISNVIAAANQFLILKCDKHIPESYVSSTQLKQIETQLQDQIRDNKLRSAAAELFQRLQSQAQVVNVYNDPKLSQQMPGVAATINKTQVTIKQLSDECVARHGSDVLEGEINRKLLDQELRRKGKTVAQADIDQEVARAADAYGFIKPDRSPDVQGWLKAVTENEHVSVELYIRDSVWPSVALKNIVGDNIQVSDDDLKKGFESNFGERVEVQAIVMSNQRQASQVWDLARNNPTEQFFGELAQQYSIEPVSRGNQGKVPPIRRFGGQPVLEEEAFRLQPGELSGIIGITDKFVVMRCLGRTKPVVTEFAAVIDELRKDIHEKKLRIAMAEEFDRLREKAQIDNFLAGTTQSGKRLADRPPATSPLTSSPIPSASPAATSTNPRGVAPATFAQPPGGKR